MEDQSEGFNSAVLSAGLSPWVDNLTKSSAGENNLNFPTYDNRKFSAPLF